MTWPILVFPDVSGYTAVTRSFSTIHCKEGSSTRSDNMDSPSQVTLVYNHSQKQLGRLHNLTVVHFNPEKREFSLLLNIPRSPYSILGYNRTITHTDISVLININLPNTFDDDCRSCTAPSKIYTANLKSGDFSLVLHLPSNKPQIKGSSGTIIPSGSLLPLLWLCSSIFIY